MPEARLQRTRAAYDRFPFTRAPLPLFVREIRPCRVYTDPRTGHTTRIHDTERFVPWHVIEGDHHGIDEGKDGAERPVSTPARGLDA